MTPHVGIAILSSLALFFTLNAIFWLVRGRARRREMAMLARLRGEALHDGGDSGRIKIRERRGDEPSRSERARQFLERAGVKAKPKKVLLVSSVSLSAFVVVAIAATGDGAMAFLVTLVGLGAAYAVLARRASATVRSFEEQMPKALEMMVFGLRAGHAFEEALALAGREVSGPLAAELSRCHEEYKLGRAIEHSLEQLRDRWPECGPLRQLVEAVVVLKRTGGNLVQVLETVSETIRAQAAFESKHRAMTSEGRLSGYILMALPGAALAFQAILVPDKVKELMMDSTGQMMMLAALVLWALGVVWVLKLVRPGNKSA
ncbi:MAG: type II secretion system F family protein [Myxococcales bacterium]|nr:type II secretion system F family protein [Myxococcales bacterium]